MDGGTSYEDCNFLIDTGSQLSLLDSSFVASFHHKPKLNVRVTSVGNKISFLGSNINLNFINPVGDPVNCNILAKNKIALDLHIPGIDNAFDLLKQSLYPMSTNCPLYDCGRIRVSGILGCDLLPLLGVLELQHVGEGVLLRLSNGYTLMGNIAPFLAGALSLPLGDVGDSLADSFINSSPHYPQVKQLKSSKPLVKRKRKNPAVNKSLNPHQQLSSKNLHRPNTNKIRKCSNQNLTGPQCHLVNFALNASASYSSPLNDIFPDSDVVHGLENFFSLESIGVSPESSSYDERYLKEFDDSVEFRNGRYYVSLPWHSDVIDRVPSNFGLAKVLAKKVSSKNADAGVAELYNQVFAEQLDQGIISELNLRDINPSAHVWIPHRPVIKNDPLTTTKVRPVFNCSLKAHGKPSLNEAAFPGVDIMGKLLNLLNYFRLNKYTLLSDIRKAFLMIHLKNQIDKNRFSFVTFDNGKFRYFQYNTILFGFVSSPFVLNYILRKHAETIEDLAVRNVVAHRMYVDNLIATHDDAFFLADLQQKASVALASGGFDLREWASNSSICLKNCPSSDCSTEPVIKVLGYLYSLPEDTLQLKLDKLDPHVNSKRAILSQISSIFDPLGFFNPFLVRCKFILRTLHLEKSTWDAPVSETAQKEWSRVCEDFCRVREITFPRQTFADSSPVTLVAFCDASKQAYGFTVYAVQESKARFFFSKVKVAPLNTRTLPTLELLAILLCLNCLSSMLSEFNFNHVKIYNIHILTDSQVALSWILKGHALKKNIFVNNRLKDISDYLKTLQEKKAAPVQFHFCPSSDNVADLVTRDISLKCYLENLERWRDGPKWITDSCSSWPIGTLGCIPTNNLSPDNALMCNPLVVNSLPECPLNISNFSSFSKLLGVMIKIKEAVLRFKKLPIDSFAIKNDSLIYLVKISQQAHFSEEINYLLLDNVARARCTTPKLVLDLALFLDADGILRSSGRIENNPFLSFDAKNPILIHKDHHFTTLIIRNTHSLCGHMGLNCTLNSLRQAGWWVPRARQAVLSVLKGCFVCKRINAKHFRPPGPPALPASRVTFTRPFAVTGIDFTGHFFVMDPFGNKQKVYILIFSCFSSRAIHLETLSSMGVDDFLLAFVRFTNIYGIPDEVYSDNAKTFISGASLLSDLITSSDFEQRFRPFNIKFKTIPLYSPHWGAVWERLIGTVKQCISKTVGRQQISYINFLTIISDAQKVINNRPLTYCSQEHTLEAITPNHLINPGRSAPSVIINKEHAEYAWELDDEEYRLALLNTLECRDTLLGKFIQLWHQQYLLGLREQYHHKIGDQSPQPSPFLKVGSIVLLQTPSKSKPFWILVKIKELLPGADNQIRSVRITKPDGSESVASIQHLYPLELEVSQEHETLPDSDNLAHDSNGTPVAMGQPEDLLGNLPSSSSTSDFEEHSLPIPGSSQSLRDGEVDNVPVTEKSVEGRPRRRAAINFTKKFKDWNAKNLV